jgi:tetratricopeptide (TPR) repeat protein
MAWNSHKVSKISLSDNSQEAVVYDMEYHGVPPHKTQQKLRWWLHAAGSTWKVWDFEDLAVGFRVSTIMGSGMASMDSAGISGSTIKEAGQKMQAAGAAMQAGDLSTAQTTLQSLNAMSLPPNFAAVRQTGWAALHVRQGLYQEALKDCDSVEATGQDVPIVFQFRAIAYNKLGQYDNALQSSQKWEDALGADSDMYYQRGLALKNLKRPADAIAAFEKSLDEDPDAAGSLFELAQLLPPGKKSEIGTRFAQADAPATVFANTAPVLQRTRDAESLQSLIDAYSARPESAGDPLLPRYRAQLKLLQTQPVPPAPPGRPTAPPTTRL